MMRLIFCSFNFALALLTCVASPALSQDFSTHNRINYAPQLYPLERTRVPRAGMDRYNVRPGCVSAPQLIIFDDILMSDPQTLSAQPSAARPVALQGPWVRSTQSPSSPGFGMPSPPQVMSPPSPAVPLSEPPLHIVRYIKRTHAHLASTKTPAGVKVSAGEPESYPSNTGYSYSPSAISVARSSVHAEVRGKVLPPSSGR
jgi:hypothetical protein